jgi:hypothetical protein
MADDLDSDRRQLRRFSMEVLSIIRAAVQNRETIVELYTRDICSGGAFFPTDHPLPAGISVEITLFLLISAFKEWQGGPRKVRIMTAGTVVRSEDSGMAVAFSPWYQMVPVPT